MHSRFVLAGALALVVAIAVAPLPAQDALQGPPGSMPQHFPKPVNLKVLPKNTTPQQLHAIMHGFAGSLGVKCSFCHAENPQTHKLDFPSDAKPEKRNARTMILMTREINASYIAKVQDPDAKPNERHVTCGTCHRGHARPAPFVIPPEEHHGPMGGGAPMSH